MPAPWTSSFGAVFGVSAKASSTSRHRPAQFDHNVASRDIARFPFDGHGGPDSEPLAAVRPKDRDCALQRWDGPGAHPHRGDRVPMTVYLGSDITALSGRRSRVGSAGYSASWGPVQRSRRATGHCRHLLDVHETSPWSEHQVSPRRACHSMVPGDGEVGSLASIIAGIQRNNAIRQWRAFGTVQRSSRLNVAVAYTGCTWCPSPCSLHLAHPRNSHGVPEFRKVPAEVLPRWENLSRPGARNAK